MAERLRLLEQQRRDEQTGRLGDVDEYQRLEERMRKRSQRLEEERRREEELENERIYHEELRR